MDAPHWPKDHNDRNCRPPLRPIQLLLDVPCGWIQNSCKILLSSPSLSNGNGNGNGKIEDSDTDILSYSYPIFYVFVGRLIFSTLSLHELLLGTFSLFWLFIQFSCFVYFWFCKNRPRWGTGHNVLIPPQIRTKRKMSYRVFWCRWSRVDGDCATGYFRPSTASWRWGTCGLRCKRDLEDR